MSMIDKNRISFLETEAFAESGLFPELFLPILPKDVPMYSTTELKSVTVDVPSAKNKEPLEDMTHYGIRTLP